MNGVGENNVLSQSVYAGLNIVERQGIMNECSWIYRWIEGYKVNMDEGHGYKDISEVQNVSEIKFDLNEIVFLYEIFKKYTCLAKLPTYRSRRRMDSENSIFLFGENKHLHVCYLFNVFMLL